MESARVTLIGRRRAASFRTNFVFLLGLDRDQWLFRWRVGLIAGEISAQRTACLCGLATGMAAETQNIGIAEKVNTFFIARLAPPLPPRLAPSLF